MTTALSSVSQAASSSLVAASGSHLTHQTRQQAAIPQYSGLRNGSGGAASPVDFKGDGRSCKKVSRSCSRRAMRGRVVAMSVEEGIPSLGLLPLVPYINGQGYIAPPIEPNTQASVFAVCDEQKKVQYIGFSKDVRNSLRTLMGRRPDKCFYYKVANLSVLDQQKMLAIRSAWMSELGLPPPGNGDPYQKNFWEKSVDAGAVSERGQAAAGASKSRELLTMMAERGLKEEMVYDPALLERGRCDVLPSKEKTAAELEALAAAEAEKAANKRHVVTTGINGEPVEFDLEFEGKFKTNGGWMYDIKVTLEDKTTVHRVVVGSMYPEASGLSPEGFVERTFAFLLSKKVMRHTEGMLTSEVFPINYFSISQVEQFYSDFKSMFNQLPEDDFWRFNRVHNYGPQLETSIGKSAAEREESQPELSFV